MLAVYPFLILVGPLALFYELKRSRERAITDRLPASLNVLSSANRMGIPFPESLGLLSRYTTGSLAREFRLTRNDLLWSSNLNRSLIAMANRIDVPQLSRTIKLIADGARSSGDLARILSIAASDARARKRLLTRRRNDMSIYIAIVMIGFVVYLLVVVFLDLGYLRPIEDIAADAEPDRRSPVSVANLPTDTYRMLLYHSVLIQAVGTGLIAGKLSADSARSGLKYAVGLVVLCLLVFTLIQP
jgi:flagellar protein FlaJ